MVDGLVLGGGPFDEQPLQGPLPASSRLGVSDSDAEQSEAGPHVAFGAVAPPDRRPRGFGQGLGQLLDGDRCAGTGGASKEHICVFADGGDVLKTRFGDLVPEVRRSTISSGTAATSRRSRSSTQLWGRYRR